mmetsp:Transcript_17758/g.36416  ORF Transcript_17758/g.36416 Transcript_17758/m.36416 type:complete len:329 (+) Transcript_17758:64-1050(+)
MVNPKEYFNGFNHLSKKYQPSTIDSLFLEKKIKEKLFSMKNNRSIPNLILAGPPGSGKTSTIFCLAKEIFENFHSQSILKLNISEERGLRIIREKTKFFCLREFPGMKLVILDEADSLDEISQGALCRMMEKFSTSVRFVLICNISSKIIEPVQSRCAILRFKKIKENLCLDFLLKILLKEKVLFDLPSVEALIFLADGDFRKILNQIEMLTGDSRLLKISRVKKLVPKLKASEVLDFLFCIFRNETHIAREIFYDFTNQGFSKLDFFSEIFEILKKTSFDNFSKIRILACFSRFRLNLHKKAFFSNPIVDFGKLEKKIRKIIRTPGN